MSRRIVICIYLLLIFSRLAGENIDSTVQQSLDQWFNKQSSVTPYISLKDDLYILFTQAHSRGLPLSLLFERLQEGVSKHVPAKRLLTALELDVEQLSEIMVMIKEVDSAGFAQKQTHFFKRKDFDGIIVEGTEDSHIVDLMHQLSIFNRSGISVESMSTLFHLAITSDKSIETMLSVFHGLIKIPGLDNLNNKETEDLGKALVKSSLTPENYGTLASIFVKGRIYHLNYSTISNLVIKVLNRGGGIVQIEQEIIQRGRKR